MKPINICILFFTLLFLMASCDAEKNLIEHTDIAHKLSNNSGLKILAIGNSFTDDATSYIPQIIDTFEEYDVFFAKIVKGGSSLQDHWCNLSSSEEKYSFYFNSYSWWFPTSIRTINEALELTDWDYVVLQQLSNTSGIYESYQPYLNNLISVIKEHNPDTKIAWHMTWAYSSTSNHGGFKNYDCDREKMYNAITEATEQVRELVDIVIPSGKVIEEFRNSEYNDNNDLTRDGYHLNKGFPCFALSCLWHEYLITPYTHESCVSGNEEKISELLFTI